MTKRLSVILLKKDLLRETPKAWGFDWNIELKHDGKVTQSNLVYFPKSLCSLVSADDTAYRLELPGWLAKKHQMTGWVKWNDNYWIN